MQGLAARYAPRLLRNAAIGAGSYLAGDALQDRFGGQDPVEGPLPAPGTTPQPPPGRLEQYQLEQQTNAVYPEGRNFMGGGIWGAGNLLGGHLPDAVLQPMVENVSAPSNPDADRNRGLLAAAPAMLSAVPYVGPFASMAAGLFSGSESRARTQGAAVPRQPIPEGAPSDPAQIGRGYQAISAEYAGAGLGPQAAVTRLMPPTQENAVVSQAIYRNLRGVEGTHFDAPRDSEARQ